MVKSQRRTVKQVAQRPTDGRVSIEEVPPPSPRPGWIIVRNHYSVISAGTERSKIEIGKKNLIAKARARPDLVRKAVEMARVEGVAPALALARERLAALSPIGYSSAGVIESLGEDVEGLAPGDRVACAGAGWANHSTLVSVPKNLVARVPAEVDLSDAAYATIGAIALHGVRQADARLGERIGVIGLGLVGQLTLRILSAAGCAGIGVDLDRQAVDLAAKTGARAFLRSASGLENIIASDASGGGLDAVIICAATASDDPLNLAVRLLRDRGRIVIVGDVPVAASRALLYEKEVELRLARSYGPGRHIREYEEHGRELPIEYVRWTEQRNLQAFVDLIAAGRVSPSEVTTHRYPLDNAIEAYETVFQSGARLRAFGVLIEYPAETVTVARSVARPTRSSNTRDRIGLIGAGAFARRTIMPLLARSGAPLVAVASEGGLTAADAARRFGFDRAATAENILADDGIDAVIIATRHSSHARLAAAALRAGKAVLVEKPLALDREELEDLAEAVPQGRFLMTGFNRRFAPHAVQIKDFLSGHPRCAMTIRVNAGPLPNEHWLHDRLIGGGRLRGEGCHFIDLIMHCIAQPLGSVHAFASPRGQRSLDCSDDFTVSLRFLGGALGTVLYTAEGDASMGKEQIEAFASGRSLTVDDFRRLRSFSDGRRRTETTRRQDKGHSGQLARFLAACRGETEPPDPQTYFASTTATLAAADSILSGAPVVMT